MLHREREHLEEALMCLQTDNVRIHAQEHALISLLTDIVRIHAQEHALISLLTYW
jgi:hypothetical protein